MEDVKRRFYAKKNKELMDEVGKTVKNFRVEKKKVVSVESRK